MWSADILSASARSALASLEKYMRSEGKCLAPHFFALRAQADKNVRAPPLVLLDIVPMHPGIGLRAIASFEEDVLL